MSNDTPSFDPPILRRLRGGLFAVVGLAVLIFCGVWLVQTRSFVRSAQAASGVVVSLNAGGSHPQVRFTTAAGLTLDYPQNGLIFGYAVGDAVPVLYDPNRPRSACINSFAALWGMQMMLALLGAVFVFTGLAVLRRSKFID